MKYSVKRDRREYYKKKYNPGSIISTFSMLLLRAELYNFIGDYGRLRYELDCQTNGLTSELNETPSGK